FCCLYEGQQVTASLNNTVSVENARSSVECILRCQRLKKTPLYTEEKKCFCFNGHPTIHNSTNTTKTGRIFEKVKFGEGETDFEPAKPNPIVRYSMIGTLSMMCTSDPNNNCEYYGNFLLSIGRLPQNQNIQLWSLAQNKFSRQPVGRPWVVTFVHSFDEYESYVTDPNEFIVLDGMIKESDSGSDDLIADFDGELLAVTDLFGTFKTKKVTQSNGDYAEVGLRINRAAK
uniref:Uncharacterized protein n=1 Tax=Clytia hemisphaerica TaxID=252671 RepID=A0A7M5X4T7_9CNID